METPAELRGRAALFRQMVRMATDQRIIDALWTLADELEAVAVQIEQEEAPDERRQAD